MNLHNIKLAIRNLKKHKLYSVLSITGFSVGFAVCIFIALFVYNELSMDKSFPESKNIVRVYDPKENNCNLDIVLNQQFKEKYPEIRFACPLEQLSDVEIAAKSGMNFTRFTGLISTTNDFFNVFPVKTISSVGSLPFEGKEAILITRSFAKILFPNEDPLGKPITVFDFIKGKITGVIEDFPKSSSIQAKVLINAENPDFLLSQSCNDGRCWNPINHFLVLQPQTELAELAKKMTTDIPKDHPEIKAIALQKLTDIYLSAPINGNGNLSGNLSLLFIFLSVGLVVLVLSIINFLNFYVSLQYTKLKEIGIKKINGASFNNLLRFSLAEVSVSILISVAISLVLFLIFLPFANQLFQRNLEASWLLRPALLSALILITAVIILINSLAPISILSRFNASSFLTKMKIGGNRQTGRRILTLTQFAASIVLLAIVFSLNKQILYAKHADLGFSKEQLLRLKLPIGFKSQDAFKQKIKELPLCESISLSRGVPGSVHLYMGDGKSDKSITYQSLYVDEDFFKTMGITMKAGRTFLTGDMGNACIMNEEALKQNEWTDFEGKRFMNGRDGGFQVVGITADFHIESMHTKIKPACLIAAANDKHDDLRDISIRLTPGNLGQQMDQLKLAWKSFIPDEPMNFSFYDEQFNAMYQKDERLGKAIGIASIIALVLTFMGILGQAFQISMNRTKEIGIRKVNGARVSDILAYMNKDFLVWVAVSLVLAIPLTMFLINKWLEDFAYKTEIGWLTYFASGLIMLVTVISTVTLQSWKAATQNPVEALRHE
ncbi:ABC transporter, permease protein [Aquipluma nitroreducens]|uniref:ABC transporter, permease protein n=1 Tax=Aquipluma nitroreducens TaxID=2010828 RepID=A0A5K7SA75_9BACT|nr:ABC transporter permease [Aquipluma nitroreducens]BBE18405.1 ABC transporter, permease protein [Aquipluma nitroreducens]